MLPPNSPLIFVMIGTLYKVRLTNPCISFKITLLIDYLTHFLSSEQRTCL